MDCLDSVVEELCYYFVEQPKLDAFPQEAALCEPLFRNAPRELSDAKDQLVNNARITAFREGLRLGLQLGCECALPPRQLP